MTAGDWRTSPPPRPCPSCGAREATCGGRQMLSGRRCCTGCDHPTDEEETER